MTSHASAYSYPFREMNKGRLWPCAIVSILLATASLTWRSSRKIQGFTVAQLSIVSLIPLIVGSCVSFPYGTNDGKHWYPANFWNEVPIAEIILSLLAINFHFKLIPEIPDFVAYYVSVGAFFLQWILFGAAMHPSHFSDVYDPYTWQKIVVKFVLSADVLFSLMISLVCLYPIPRIMKPSDYKQRFFNLYANVFNYSFFKLTCMREFHFKYFIAHFIFPLFFVGLYVLDWRRNGPVAPAEKEEEATTPELDAAEFSMPQPVTLSYPQI